MIINSENIVDDFLKKISESLPVEERDAYQTWKKITMKKFFTQQNIEKLQLLKEE